MIDIKRILNDYKPNTTIWNEDTNEVHQLKQAFQALNDSDKIIFLLYVEYGSLRKVGKDVGVSHTIVYKEITRIKNLMYDYIRNNNNSGNNMLLNRFKRNNNDN